MHRKTTREETAKKSNSLGLNYKPEYLMQVRIQSTLFTKDMEEEKQSGQKDEKFSQR